MDISHLVKDGMPVLDTTWREIEPARGRDRLQGRVVALGAGPKAVTLDCGATASAYAFLRVYEPVCSGVDWLTEASARAEVRALTMVSPIEGYPLTFATAWAPATLEERQWQMIASRGFFCGDCHDMPEDLRAETEVIRFAQYHPCHNGHGGTLWYHLADEARTRTCMSRLGAGT